MDEQLNDNESLISRIQQLERERDALHKDIEQLCMQQAGPSYLSVATRMHFQRTAGLEQEIENLKKQLAACVIENSNLQEELSEAYRIKSQLADLHAAEVSKCTEAEKQVKFFQGCVAAAFAERDHSIMEAEKVKEKEEVMLQKLSNFQRRVEELTFDFLEEKKLTDALQFALEEQNKQNETLKKVINKFYEIRQYSVNDMSESGSWEDKCECLLRDSNEMWDFNDQGETSSSKYISALEEEVDALKKSMDNLQNKLCVGLEIENHLKKRVYDLEKKKTLSEELIKKGISGLHNYHSQHKDNIMNILDEGYSHLTSIVNAVEEKIRQLNGSREQSRKFPRRDVTLDEDDFRDVHINMIAGSDLINKGNGSRLPKSMAIASGDSSEALAQALQEKVATLLLLSQQDERHLLERNVTVSLQKKVEELQRSLLQVTNEKVKSLMEMAQLKREYQLLQEKTNHEITQGKLLAEIGEKRIVQERDGRLRNLMKKTYLKRWMGTVGSPGNEAEAHLNYEGNKSFSYRMDIARMKIENATLKESLESMEHLTSAICRLRLSLLKVQESITSGGTVTGALEALDDIVGEAKLMRTAFGISLPVSWSAEADARLTGESYDQEITDVSRESSSEKVDFVSAAGFEMVEILILAAQPRSKLIGAKSACDGLSSNFGFILSSVTGWR
ncbi:Sporulation-specific protein [Actinidia chinensis var. chinensis]|uniref:Sporulation-specific protein n=1 Tax=Actinidia chinensis var. chinensis TaxID=1590841 RepID=A0A2R6RGX4_ACTCC|nr:Sporulation-specific protein [Actinidia chinensis var. chinensis]